MTKVLTYPNPALDKKCSEVQTFDTNLHNILDEMREIVEQPHVLGLASNQIDLNLNMFLIKDIKGNINEIINPIIIEQKNTQFNDESCLSFPGITVRVSRPETIHFTYQDRFGEKREGLVHGIEAICFFHENDHLNGLTILHKVNRLERKKILKYLRSK